MTKNSDEIEAVSQNKKLTIGATPLALIPSYCTTAPTPWLPGALLVSPDGRPNIRLTDNASFGVKKPLKRNRMFPHGLDALDPK